MDCYILHTFLLATHYYIIICYHYAKHASKPKKYLPINNIKMENNEFKKIDIKNRTCYYFNDIIKIQDFDFNNILLDEKSCENILIYDVFL